MSEITPEERAALVEIHELRETVRRLNRRVQLADAALAEKWKPNSPSFGKALLRWGWQKEIEKTAALEAALAKLREAAGNVCNPRVQHDAEAKAWVSVPWQLVEALRAELGEHAD